MPSDAERGGEYLERRITGDERVELVRQGLATWREGFLAYLLLPRIDLSDRQMEDHFTDCYAGWFPDRQSFCETQVGALWWRDALDDLTRAHDLPESGLDFNWDAIWAHCCEIYDVIEQLGGVHVFTR